MDTNKIRIGSLAELEEQGCLTGKAGPLPVCVFWNDGEPRAVEDRCPHMGFPLHRGTVESGLLTCHWHHARFDLTTGSTLDPWADDVRAFATAVDRDDVFVLPNPAASEADHLLERLGAGLEQGLTLVIAKAVLGLLDSGVKPARIVEAAVNFGCANRAEGWGSGLTVLVAMANLLPRLADEDRALALVHGLSFVSRDTRRHSPRFPLTPLGAKVPPARLQQWFRRFIDTRSEDASERVLLTALAADAGVAVAERALFAAATDHLFLDEGHVLDFTNKAVEVLAHVGAEAATIALPTLVNQMVRATRHEELSAWRHPNDLVALLRDVEAEIPSLFETATTTAAIPGALSDTDVAKLGLEVLGDDPLCVTRALTTALARGATPEQAARAVAFAAAMRITRFHTQNDHGDWDVVHHGFTAANAVHQAIVRRPTPELLRGVFQCAMKVYLDRFLNVPAARVPSAATGDLDGLRACWDTQGHVDEAGRIAYGYLAGGGDPAELIVALTSALLHEDAGFHWYQTVEAAIRQFDAWPRASSEGALILAGTARFLAAHTPTRRELPQVVHIATRLRRGDPLYEEDPGTISP